MTALDLIGVYARLRAAVKQAGDQQTYARQIGISPAYLSDVLNARREPGDSILSALGLRKQVRYVEARNQSATADGLAHPRADVSSQSNSPGARASGAFSREG